VRQKREVRIGPSRIQVRTNTHTTIVFARYIMLELARRSAKDSRTLGTLFHAGCDELRQASFAEAVTVLLNTLQQLVKSFGDKIAAPVAEALAAFMVQIPGLLRRPMLLPACIILKINAISNRCAV